MATIDKINVNGTTYDISTISVTTVTVGKGPTGHNVEVLIDSDTKEIDILVVDCDLVKTDPDDTQLTVEYRTASGGIGGIFNVAGFDPGYGFHFMGKLIKTNTGDLKGSYLVEYRGLTQSTTSTRMGIAQDATGFSSRHTLIINFSNLSNTTSSSGTIDVLIVEKK